MKQRSTIWNKFVLVLCGLLAAFALVPQQECFCSTPSTDSACAISAKKSHDCCSSDSSELQSSSQVHDDGSCCCAPTHDRLLGQSNGLMLADAVSFDATNTFQKGDWKQISDTPSLSTVELHNDLLKPSKIYLIKRVLLI